MFEYEEMSLNAWPSIKSALYKGCLLRSSHGYTNRANSANPLYIREEDMIDVVTHAEEFYYREKLPVVFKILSFKEYSGLDDYLLKREYEKIHDTMLMKADFTQYVNPHGPINLENHFSDEWFESFVRINKISDSSVLTAKHMLDLLTVPVIVASLTRHGKIVACGYGAIEREYVGFFDIVVESEYRGKGLGKAIMGGIIEEAVRKGVPTGYLQVLKSNEIAKNLYQSLGFKQIYSYWYRRRVYS